MFNYYQRLLVVGLFLAGLCGVSWGRGDVCLLNSAERLCDHLAWDPEDAVALKELSDLDSFVKAKLGDGELENSERWYFEGYLAWRQEKFLEARNAWFKFLSLERMGNESPSPQRAEEVRRFFRLLTEDHLIPAPQPLEEEKVKGDDTTLSRPQIKSRSLAGSRAGVDNVERPRISIDEIVRKAGEAKEHGQWERALRLYQMALKLAPESPQVQEEMAQLEKEMK